MNHFWLRVADVCIFPNIYIFWVILSIIEAAFLKKKKKKSFTVVFGNFFQATNLFGKF